MLVLGVVDVRRAPAPVQEGEHPIVGRSAEWVKVEAQPGQVFKTYPMASAFLRGLQVDDERLSLLEGLWKAVDWNSASVARRARHHPVEIH